MNLVALAKRYISVGIGVLPVKTDTSKSPAVNEWKYLQARHASDSEIESLFGGDCGLAALGGKVSGSLEIYDIDSADLFEPWSALVKEHIGADFYASLVIVKTPRPGFHIYTRCAAIQGSQKLAMRPITGADGKPSAKVLIETKGEGGYTLLPGCPPTCHETGRTYEIFQGTFRSVPLITTEERDIMIRCARSFNEMIRSEGTGERHSATHNETPGNDYAAKTTWAEILKPHGYTQASHRGDMDLWTRPGKERGISASTNFAGSGLFYPFSTNCYPFDSGRGYSKFGAFALLNHAGDFHAAAVRLAADGYGTRSKAPSDPPFEVATAPTASDGGIVEVMDMLPEVALLHETGLLPGESTGWPALNGWYSVRKREWTLITGHPNHGKSCWLDNLMVNLARRADWKFGIFSAENVPLARYVATFMELYTGKPFSKGPTPRLTLAEVHAAAGWVHDHFKFFNPTMQQRRIDNLLIIGKTLVEKHKCDALVIDPWNELDHARPKNLREDEHISISLSKVREFARTMNVHFFLVAHPSKILRDQKGNQPVPTMFDVKGASEWNAKADNGICVWRDIHHPEKGTDIHIQKVRFREVGKAGGGCNLQYNLVNGRFTDPDERPPQGDDGWI